MAVVLSDKEKDWERKTFEIIFNIKNPEPLILYVLCSCSIQSLCGDMCSVAHVRFL